MIRLQRTIGFTGTPSQLLFFLLLGIVVSMAFLSERSQAQVVDQPANKTETVPVKLDLIDGFIKVDDWKLPFPLIPLSAFGSLPTAGTISGSGKLVLPGWSQGSKKFKVKVPANDNYEATVRLVKTNNWTGQINPVTGEVKWSSMPIRIDINTTASIPGVDRDMTCNLSVNLAAGLDSISSRYQGGADYNPMLGSFTTSNPGLKLPGVSCSLPDFASIYNEDAESIFNKYLNIPCDPEEAIIVTKFQFFAGWGEDPDPNTYSYPKPAIRPTFSIDSTTQGSISLDASSSYTKASPATYSWDFNQDGLADQTSSSPTLTRDSAGITKVGLKVSDGDGDESLWTIQDVTNPVVPVPPQTLQINKAGKGRGKVISSPEGIACGKICEKEFPASSTVLLKAIPNPGSAFKGWAGACSGSKPICQISMTEARAATARFGKLPSAAVFDGKRLRFRLKCPKAVKPACKGRAFVYLKKKNGKLTKPVTTRPANASQKSGRWKNVRLLVKTRFRKTLWALSKLPARRSLVVKQRLKVNGKTRIFTHTYLIRVRKLTPQT